MKLYSHLDTNDVRSFVRAHVDLQLGCYFSEKIQCQSGLLCVSKHIDDYYWNTLCSFNESSTETIYKEAENSFLHRNRNPAFYLDPSCEPKSMADFLLSKNFSYEKEIWMVADAINTKYSVE